MRLRVLIFDDEPAIRQLLWTVCDRRGYEVFTFPDPGRCPLYLMRRCPCGPGAACADFLLVDLHMPEVAGLDFVEGLRAKGCVGAHIGPMSGDWTPAARARAAAWEETA